MNYQQTLDYMFSRLPMYQRIGPAAYKANLDNTLALSKHLDQPENRFKSIHIAGTNGKGSVAHMLASVLQQAGYKTGLATSPHLKDFRERIKINGKCVSEQFVVDFIRQHKSYLERINPSFFEMTIAMTFDYFAKEAVDMAVIETGMGGRLDSTNIITPEISVITKIGLDHTRFLGNSIEQIAIEKGGIIKKNIPVVVAKYQPETYDVYKQFSDELNAPIVFADKLFSVENSDLFLLQGKKFLKVHISALQGNRKSFLLDLLGHYQAENLLCALTVLNRLQKEKKIKISEKDIREGLCNVARNTGLQGRWQQLGDHPMVICDTGHNTDSFKYIVKQIKSTPHKRLHVVIGMVEDKEISSMLSLLPPNASYYFCRPNVPRGLDQKKLADKASCFSLHGKHYSNVADAFQAAKKDADTDDLIFIGGSTFVVAEVL